MKEKPIDNTTRQRLLKNAEILFAEKGFHAVSVREITKAAKCNLAAVNYHFGGKMNLYLEVFRSRWVPRARRIHHSFEEALQGQESPLIDDVVGALAHAFLEGPLTDEERRCHSQLMYRELANPTGALDLLAENVMQPFFMKLRNLLRPHLPETIGDDRLLLSIISIIAMVIHFNFSREAVSRLTGRTYDSDFKARLVEHITEFSLKGLDGMNQQEQQA